MSIDPSAPLSSSLPGSEAVLVNVLLGMQSRGFEIAYAGNVVLPGAHASGSFRHVPESFPVVDLGEVESGSDLSLLWLRDYIPQNAQLDRLSSAYHTLLIEDSVRDISAIFRDDPGTIDALPSLQDRFNNIVFVSEWQRNDWAENIHQSFANAAVIYNWCRHVPWRKAISEAAHERVVHTSHPRKAFANIVRIAPLLFEAGYRLSVCGQPTLYRDESALIVEPPLQPGGRFSNLGPFAEVAYSLRGVVDLDEPVCAAEMAQYLARFSMMIHPDYSGETGACTIIEAIRCGLIPIVSSAGALPELVGDAGVVVSGRPIGNNYAVRFASAVDSIDGAARSRLASSRSALFERYSDSALSNKWFEALTA